MENVQSRQALELLPEYPEFVYYNLPIYLAPIVITFPNKKVNITENASAEPQQDEISIKMRNNEVWKQNPKLNNKIIYDSIASFLPDDVRNAFCQMSEDFFNKIERQLFVEFIVALYSASNENNRSTIEFIIKRTIEGEGELNVNNNCQRRMEIEGVYFKGKYYPFERIQEDLRPQIEEIMNPYAGLCHVKPGKYLYRAIDKAEWSQILRDMAYFVRTKTNFEDKIGHQVIHYSKSDGYAGKVIRIKVEGPWFKDAGFQVPRVESFSAFYANVEVLEGDQWLPIDKYSE